MADQIDEHYEGKGMTITSSRRSGRPARFELKLLMSSEWCSKQMEREELQALETLIRRALEGK